MSRMSKGLPLFPNALKLLKFKPGKVKTHTARKAGARILTKQKKRANPNDYYAYRSAEISFQAGACDAARKMEGRRFLVRDIPMILVPDCTSTNCKCSYVRYKDRRS